MDRRHELLEKFKDIPQPARWPTGDVASQIDFRAIEKWNIPEKIVIGVAVVGGFLEEEGEIAKRLTPKAVLQQYMECIELGSRSLHVSVRDEKGKHSARLDLYHSVVDPIREKYGKNVVIDGGVQPGDNFKERMGPITENVFDVATIITTSGLLGDRLRAMHPRTLQAQAEYYAECGVKPIIDVHDSSSIDNAKRYLIDTKLLKKPYAWHVLLGLPGTFYVPNVKGMIEGMTYMCNRIHELDPDSVIMVSNPARASSYMVALSIIMGLNLRLGEEDTIYLYPHKDDETKGSKDSVMQGVQLARLLGREPATGLEHRKMLGID